MSLFLMNFGSLKIADICIIGLVVLWAAIVLASGLRRWKKGKGFCCGCCNGCSKCNRHNNK